MQNIFGNKQAPSRDIAAHFSMIEHLRFVCEGGFYNDQMESHASGVCDQFMFVKVNITELGVELTIEQLLQMDPPFHVNLHLSSLLDGKVQQFKAVMSYVLELVHTGDYIELQPPFCELISTIKSETGHTLCLVQAMVLPDGQPLLNPFDCPLYNLSRKIFTVDTNAIVRPVSMVHECAN
ncbi:hypothetical protein EMCRGX_G002103 [Ephydatia muelleri]